MGKPGGAVDLDRFEKVCARLGEVVVDPVAWPDVMSDVCAAVGATGAALLQSDVRTPDVPQTESVAEAFTHYFKNNWHTRDIRAQRAVPLFLKGESVVVDQDILTPEEMRKDPLYGEVLLPFGIEWFGVVAFQAGPALWGLSIQRSPKEGPFERRDKAILSTLSRKLTGVASLSHALGRVAVAGATNALNNLRSPAIAIDRSGNVLDVNHAAQALLDSHIRIRERRLAFADPQASACLDRLIERLGATSETGTIQHDPIVIRRPDQGPVLLRAMPVHPAARTPFLGARALLTLTPVEVKRGPHPGLLSKVFGLTPAEAKLASIMAEGSNPEEAAEDLQISRDTARNQLRAIFAKTATHRQSELVALLSRL